MNWGTPVESKHIVRVFQRAWDPDAASCLCQLVQLFRIPPTSDHLCERGVYQHADAKTIDPPVSTGNLPSFVHSHEGYLVASLRELRRNLAPDAFGGTCK
jgi:hypothetical protein